MDVADINRLLSDELTHELLLLGCTEGNTVADKRRLLRELLHNDLGERKNLNLEASSELNICSIKLDQLLGFIQEFDHSNRINEYQRILARLNHVNRRLQRIILTNDLQQYDLFVSKKSGLEKLCTELFTVLEKLFKEPSNQTCSPRPLLDEPIPSTNKAGEILIDLEPDLENTSSRRVSFAESRYDTMIV